MHPANGFREWEDVVELLLIGINANIVSVRTLRRAAATVFQISGDKISGARVAAHPRLVIERDSPRLS